MDTIDRLARIFEKFPGIGPRQAQRFVAYLLRSSPAMRRELADAIHELSGAVRQCAECQRYHAGSAKACALCSNPERNEAQLAVVASDADVIALERSGNYRGRYFVLGGTISLASEKIHGLRIKTLIDSLEKRAAKGLREVILAFPANPEGDATAARVRTDISSHPPLQGVPLEITTLGRGLSTGSELEYADPETLKSALESRR